MTDPIADMLTRIRNAQAVQKPEVEISFSRIKYQIAKILEKETFIKGVKRVGRGTGRKIILLLKYENNLPGIRGIKRDSKPGQRIYKAVSELRQIRGGFGIAVVSTSGGIMTAKEAKGKNIGGEILCEVW